MSIATKKMKKPVYVKSYASVVGKKEGEGPLGTEFDVIVEDPFFGGDAWEEAESRLQAQIAHIAMLKANLTTEDVDYIYAGDLLGQLIASSYGLKELDIPMFGLYGACSTFGEALALGSMSIDGGFAKNVLCVTSSHFAAAEKTFRYPLLYGSQRKYSATWTVTGGGGIILSTDKSHIKITSITTGRIVDYGFKDKENMGACMAPAAADTIMRHFKETGEDIHSYDKIITGDLGIIGRIILCDILNEHNLNIEEIHMDCGMKIFDNDLQDTHSGASGCGCVASVLCGYIFRKIESKEWKKVLVVPTGALFSPVTANEGDSILGIAHGVVFEYEE